MSEYTDIYGDYVGLLDERKAWEHELKHNLWTEPFILEQYRKNRNSNEWRTTRQVERLCEYVLFLEKKLEEFNDRFKNKSFK